MGDACVCSGSCAALVGVGAALALLAACSSDSGRDDSTGTTAAPSETTAGADEQIAPEGVSLEGTGPSPAGLLTEEALAQPGCNENGRTDLNIIGGGPFCVRPFAEGEDNGGATAPGVTATEVKVVIYSPNAQMMGFSSTPTNQATGQPTTPELALADFGTLYDQLVADGTYQLWGRRPVFELVEASGPDEAAQRADAVEVIERQPFMVVDITATTAGGAAVFSTAVAARDIVVVSASTTSEIGLEQRPYRWNYSADPSAEPYLTAAFIGRTLADGPAQYAGDEALAGEDRSFGAIYPAADFDPALFASLLEENGAPPLAEEVAFDETDPAAFGEQAATVVNRLKSSGVTSVVLFAQPTFVTPIMAAATAQDYFPEWILTGHGFQDFALFMRNLDQTQAAHAFGLSPLFPTLDLPEDAAYLDLFDWYWGTDQGNIWGIAAGVPSFVYNAMHYAGPDLTPENVEAGLFSVPASGGAATGTVVYQAGYGNSTGLPYASYGQLGSDRAFAWWNPDIEGLAQTAGIMGQGVMMYLDDGARYSYSSIPDEEPVFFDPATAVNHVAIADQSGADALVAAPCEGCPSES